jgi:hypothetical protein
MNWYINTTENIKTYFLTLDLNKSILKYRRPCGKLQIRNAADGTENLKRDKERKTKDNAVGRPDVLSYGLHQVPSDIRNISQRIK